MRCNLRDKIFCINSSFFPCCEGLRLWKEGGTLAEALKSEEFQKIKESIEKGTYQYCDLNYCRKYISELNRGAVFLEPGRVSYRPESLHLGVDGTCNICCRSCRDEKYTQRYEEVKQRLQDIEEVAAPVCRFLDLSSAGEFLASRATIEWFRNLDLSKWKNLKSIHLRTNGLLFTEDFWNSLRVEIRDLISNIQVSVDATTKEVYENIRRGASWDVLQKNLAFIYTLQKPLQLSFVIQVPNHFQIVDFYKDVQKLRDSEIVAFALFQPIEKWPGVSEENYKKLSIYEDETVWKETWNQLRSIGQENLIKEPTYKPGTLLKHSLV